jgi:hypothetical protein
VLLREHAVTDDILDLLADAPTGNGYGHHEIEEQEEY